MPTKDLAPYSIDSPQKPSFKPINDHFIVADICYVQLNHQCRIFAGSAIICPPTNPDDACRKFVL